MTNLNIRVAGEFDVGSIYALECEYGYDLYSLNMIKSDINNNQTITLVGEIDKKVVAYLSAMIVFDECELLKIIVANSNKHQGIGRKLLKYLEKYCLDNCVKEILLEVREDNDVAKVFYEKIGFVKNGVRKGYYNGIDALLYKLNIDETKSKL